MLWHSEYFLYSSYCFFNHYQTFQRNPSATKEDLRSKANTLLLKTLSVPPISLENSQNEANRAKVTALIGTAKYVPVRDELIKLTKILHIVELASPEVRELYNLVEEGFNLLTFSKTAGDVLSKLRAHKEFSIYTQHIEQNLI